MKHRSHYYKILASDLTWDHHLLDLCVALCKVAHFIFLGWGDKNWSSWECVWCPFFLGVPSNAIKGVRLRRRSYVSLQGNKEDEVRSELSREGRITDWKWQIGNLGWGGNRTLEHRGIQANYSRKCRTNDREGIDVKWKEEFQGVF